MESLHCSHSLPPKECVSQWWLSICWQEVQNVQTNLISVASSNISRAVYFYFPYLVVKAPHAAAAAAAAPDASQRTKEAESLRLCSTCAAGCVSVISWKNSRCRAAMLNAVEWVLLNVFAMQKHSCQRDAWILLRYMSAGRARLNFVSHCLWQTQRRTSEKHRTLMTSAASAPLSVIISLVDIPHQHVQISTGHLFDPSDGALLHGWPGPDCVK